MSVRSFHSVFMVGGVAAAALSCYLVSLRVATERAALEGVETEIVLAQRDIRLLQTEIGTRGRLAQLERWNVKVLALSAPSADQFVADGFQLAQMISPQATPAMDAPVVYASAPPAPPPAVLPEAGESANERSQPLLHEASFKLPERAAKTRPAEASEDSKPASAKAKPAAPTKAKPAAPTKAAASDKPSPPAAKPPRKSDSARTVLAEAKPRPVAPKPPKAAKADPLAPLPGTTKPAAAPKRAASSTTKDSGKRQ